MHDWTNIIDSPFLSMQGRVNAIARIHGGSITLHGKVVQTVPIDRLLDILLQQKDFINLWFTEIQQLVRLQYDACTKLNTVPFTYEHYCSIVQQVRIK